MFSCQFLNEGTPFVIFFIVSTKTQIKMFHTKLHQNLIVNEEFFLVMRGGGGAGSGEGAPICENFQLTIK